MSRQPQASETQRARRPAPCPRSRPTTSAVSAEASSDPTINPASHEADAVIAVLPAVSQKPAASGFIADTSSPTPASRQGEAGAPPLLRYVGRFRRPRA